MQLVSLWSEITGERGRLAVVYWLSKFDYRGTIILFHSAARCIYKLSFLILPHVKCLIIMFSYSKMPWFLFFDFTDFNCSWITCQLHKLNSGSPVFSGRSFFSLLIRFFFFSYTFCMNTNDIYLSLQWMRRLSHVLVKQHYILRFF